MCSICTSWPPQTMLEAKYVYVLIKSHTYMDVCSCTLTMVCIIHSFLTIQYTYWKSPQVSSGSSNVVFLLAVFHRGRYKLLSCFSIDEHIPVEKLFDILSNSSINIPLHVITAVLRGWSSEPWGLLRIFQGLCELNYFK